MISLTSQNERAVTNMRKIHKRSTGIFIEKHRRFQKAHCNPNLHKYAWCGAVKVRACKNFSG
jgi:hypothetical protein